MIYNLYAIYDKDAQEYGPLFNAKNALIASRYVEEMIKEVKNVDPYALYCMGEYDTEKGIISTNVHFVSDCAEMNEFVEKTE